MDKQLSSGELGVLAQVAQRIEELLTLCFENYFMLRCVGANAQQLGLGPGRPDGPKKCMQKCTS